MQPVRALFVSAYLAIAAGPIDLLRSSLDDDTSQVRTAATVYSRFWPQHVLHSLGSEAFRMGSSGCFAYSVRREGGPRMSRGREFVVILS